MNDKTLRKILEAAGKTAPALPPDDFSERVLRAVRRAAEPEEDAVFRQFNLWFLRLAQASALIIAASFVCDYLASAAQWPNLADGVTQLTDQWLFALNVF